MKKMKKLASLCTILFVSVLPVAQAAQIRLDGAGFDVVYDDALLGLFGTPSLLGGTSLVFNPISFSALSTSSNWSFTNASIGFTLVADSGFTLDSAGLVERGNYLKFGNVGTVFASGQTSWYDLRTPTSLDTGAITGAEPAVLTVQNFPLTANWQANSSQVFTAGATEIHFSIQSLMAAKAGGSGDFAFIDKNYMALTVSAVPEASQYAMLCFGLGVIGLARRTRAR